jgi:hypothetical protein
METLRNEPAAARARTAQVVCLPVRTRDVEENEEAKMLTSFADGRTPKENVLSE